MNHRYDKCSYAGRSAEDWYVTAQCEAQLAEERAGTIKNLTAERDALGRSLDASASTISLLSEQVGHVERERDEWKCANQRWHEWALEICQPPHEHWPLREQISDALVTARQERDAAKKNFEHLRETAKNASQTFQSVVDRAEKAERDYERIADALATVDAERCTALAQLATARGLLAEVYGAQPAACTGRLVRLDSGGVAPCGACLWCRVRAAHLGMSR